VAALTQRRARARARSCIELAEVEEVNLDGAVLEASGGEDGALRPPLQFATAATTSVEAARSRLPYPTGSVALLGRFRRRRPQQPRSGRRPAPPPPTRTAEGELCVGTVHVHWDWKRREPRCRLVRVSPLCVRAAARGWGRTPAPPPVALAFAVTPTGCLIGAPWLVNGGHGTSLKQPFR
jgi:hypothetical protein